MRSVYQRLYETKLLFLASGSTVLGLGLLMFARMSAASRGWLDVLPFNDLGSALLTTGIVVIAFEYLDGRDSEQRATRQLRRILHEQAPAMRDAVIRGFAVDANDLARVSSPAVLDQVARNALTVQLGDQELAHEVYEDLRVQVLRPEERHHDLRVRIDLRLRDSSFFEATVRWEYTALLAPGVRRFTCVSDAEEYRDLSYEPARASIWHFPPIGDLAAGAKEVFELTRFSIDGTDRPIRRAIAKDGRSQTYAVSPGALDEKSAQPARVAYTYRVLVRRQGHLLHLAVGQPTRNVDLQLNYQGCGIQDLRVLDFMASGRRPTVAAALPTPEDDIATVSFDGWALPRSGVAFVWTLNDRAEPADTS